MKLDFDVMETLCDIIVSDDEMEARMVLYEPPEEIAYTEDVFLQYLEEKGVKQGVCREALQKALKAESYNVSFPIAEGTQKIDGEDGFFEYFFDRNLQAKPEVREDGSVDYLNMKLFEEAEEGQLLVRYHPATKGIDGKNVRGKLLKAKDGKKLPPIKGSGFEIRNDGIDYLSVITGRITYKNERLKIDPLYVVDEVSYSSGNIKFRGDVLVKGAVRSGMTVEATGDVMVNGNIESATIISGGNVLVKRGATSDFKGKITAKGNVSGKFFESVTIESQESVFSDYFMNCDITAEKSVVATGRKGSLVGGVARCWEEVHVKNLGNRAGVHTVVSMFYEANIAERLELYRKEMDNLTDEIMSVQKQIEVYEKAHPGADRENSLPLVRLVYQQKQAEKQRQEVQESWLALRTVRDEKNKGKVVIENIGYAGCLISFGAVEEQLKDSQKELKITRMGDALVKESL